jgi:phosphatidylglycerophosphatase A
MNNVQKNITLFIAQGAYSGRVPFAPGTAGTAIAVLLYLLVRGLSPFLYVLFCIGVLTIGTWVAGRAEVILEKKDSPSIVIDEIAGYLIAMCMVPQGWGFVAAGFILFRTFDIWKPWPLKRLQDLHGGVGIMLDDVGAAVYTNMVLQIVILLMK